MIADYLLPRGMSLAAAGRELAGRLDVRAGGERRCHRAYYDTFDGLLHAAGVMAVWEERQLALIDRDSDGVRARVTIEKPAHRLFAHDLPEGRMRDALHVLIDVRALLPLIELRVRERPVDVLDSERKTVVRMQVEEPMLGRTRLDSRVHLRAVRGYESSLGRIAETLGSDLGLARADHLLLDDALVTSGIDPGGASATAGVAIVRGQRADGAATAVLKGLLDVIEANLEGAVADIDSEFLHDLRVAVRRSRAVQRELRRVFPPKELRHFRREFRRLQQVTGEARDLDVYVLEFDALRVLVLPGTQADLDPLLDVLRRRRASARRRMVRALGSERTSRLLAEWRSFLDQLESLPTDDRPDADAPIETVAGERIRRIYRRMVKTGSAIDAQSPADEYHGLRKQGKELRYLLELFGAPLFAGDLAKPLVKALKRLQDVLGRHQDREVQVATLRSMRDDVAAGPRASAALMAMGTLVHLLDADQREARTAFAQRFQAFAPRSQHSLVEDTFL